MWRILFVTVFLMMACNQKKSDTELFAEGKLGVDLSASANMGYRPLYVDFTGYLETEERTVDRKIDEVRWLIRGPNGYEREIIKDSQNYQDEEENKESFFYLEYQFNLPGKYYVQLLLNDGEYSSIKVPITVLDKPQRNNSRF